MNKQQKQIRKVQQNKKTVFTDWIRTNYRFNAVIAMRLAYPIGYWDSVD